MELKRFFKPKQIEVGCDEAGRGCLAGHVVASAVIFPLGFYSKEINDSKKLSHSKRDEARRIIETNAIDFSVSFVSPATIDEINILKASLLAIHQALDQLKTPFDQILVDGNRFVPYKDKPHKCIIKGDGRFLNIAAASILAKTYRDEYMLMLSKKYPNYYWDKNKGYPTKMHRRAIQIFGITKHHRISFNCVKR